MTTHTETLGRLPIRRVIVIAFACAVIAGSIGTWVAGEPVVTEAATVAPAPALHADQPLCNGEAINRGCAMVEGTEPGPVVALGYSSEPQARFHCAGGEVVTLYRQKLIVGYGCERGSR